MKKKNNVEESYELSKKFRAAFPKVHPTEWEIIHLIFSNYLTSQGDVRRKVEICLESKIDNLNKYTWLIPLPKAHQKKVHGLSIHDSSNEILEYKLSYYDENQNVSDDNPDYAKLEIFFSPLGKEERKTFHFEYFIEKYSRKISTKFFHNIWKYNWGYKIHSKTHRYEHRVIIPEHCSITKNGFITNMSNPPIKFSYGNTESIIWMEEKPNYGDLNGEVEYRQESRVAAIVLASIGGILIGLITTLIIAIPAWYIILIIFVVSLAIVFGTVFLYKKFLFTIE